MKNVPEQIEKYKKKKYYLHATELLVSTGMLLHLHMHVHFLYTSRLSAINCNFLKHNLLLPLCSVTT